MVGRRTGRESAMWYTAVAAVAGLLLATTARADVKPSAFQDMTHIACSEQQMAVYLLSVFEEDTALGEMLLTELTMRGRCERATFSGMPVADTHPRKPTGNL